VLPWLAFLITPLRIIWRVASSKKAIVAICEQVGDQPAKGFFLASRPGGYTRNAHRGGLLPGDSNNYLNLHRPRGGRAGIAYVDNFHRRVCRNRTRCAGGFFGWLFKFREFAPIVQN